MVEHVGGGRQGQRQVPEAGRVADRLDTNPVPGRGEAVTVQGRHIGVRDQPVGLEVALGGLGRTHLNVTVHEPHPPQVFLVIAGPGLGVDEIDQGHDIRPR
jgi:hypothetical protein